MSETFISIDPATEATLATYQPFPLSEVEARLDRAVRAFEEWRTQPLDVRADVLVRVADVLGARRDTYACLVTDEMGKLLADARAEIDKCAAACRHYATNAARMLASEAVPLDDVGPTRAPGVTAGSVVFDPLGPLLAIMPWNFPFWQVFRFAVPALVAGNVALVKHAPNVCGTALAIEAAWRDAGAPAGVLQTLIVPAASVPSLLADDRIRAVTLTGSERAGASVAEAAGRVCKKCVLELGGSDAFIVLADADVAVAARSAAAARVVNGGQSCIAAKRFIVLEPLVAAFTDALRDAMQALVIGDPRDAGTQLGPLARTDLRATVARQVEASVAAGARLVCGGGTPPRPGFFYQPTVLAGVRPGMPAFDEEVFGPVAAVIAARDEADALALANATRYGLAASIWTGDPEHAQALARRLDVGMVFVNDMVRSDPRLPFGGVKRSGYGRELSHYGIHEFVNVRTIVVRRPPAAFRDAKPVE